MGRSCQKCKKSVGFFSGGETCDHPDCTVSECEDCTGKVLKTCDKCGIAFCIKHISNHPCHIQAQDQEEYDIESPMVVSEDKTKKWRWFSHIDYESSELVQKVDELEQEGFEFRFVVGDIIYMKKKGDKK